MSFDFKVGDVVVRRDGTEDVIYSVNESKIFAVRGKKDVYTKTGDYWLNGANDLDIVSIKNTTPTKESPITLRGPEALIFLRDNKGARIMEVDGETVVNTDSLVDVMRLISANYKCWIEPQPRYTTTDSQILDNGKELSRQEIADLLNKCDADG